jgi:hypothetical protein
MPPSDQKPGLILTDAPAPPMALRCPNPQCNAPLSARVSANGFGSIAKICGRCGHDWPGELHG